MDTCLPTPRLHQGFGIYVRDNLHPGQLQSQGSGDHTQPANVAGHPAADLGQLLGAKPEPGTRIPSEDQSHEHAGCQPLKIETDQ